MPYQVSELHTTWPQRLGDPCCWSYLLCTVSASGGVGEGLATFIPLLGGKSQKLKSIAHLHHCSRPIMRPLECTSQKLSFEGCTYTACCCSRAGFLIAHSLLWEEWISAQHKHFSMTPAHSGGEQPSAAFSSYKCMSMTPAHSGGEQPSAACSLYNCMSMTPTHSGG
eukprot:1157222-Pelagomonas_calceolata.AAC.8